MNDSTLLHGRIVRLFSERLNLEVPSVDTDLVESGILDSLAFVDLIVSLEQEFGTGVPTDDLEIDNFRSVTKIAELVLTRSELRGAA